MNREINNSKLQQIGIPYQILVGIDYACSKLYNNWKEIKIEHEGDITFDKNIQIEAKHHYGKSTLGNRDEEFWKTLRNWLRKPDIKEFKILVLHITKEIPNNNRRENSIFKNWNENNSSEKAEKNYENIKSNAFTKEHIALQKPETIEYYNEIFDSFTKEEIINVISKIRIDFAQLNYDAYLKFMADNNPAFASIAYNKENFIQEEFVNWIDGKKKEKEWSIDYKNFFLQLQQKKEKYNNSQYSIYFDKYEKTSIDEAEIKSYFDFNFIQKLNDINCPIDVKEEAIKNYVCTIKLLGEINSKVDVLFIDEIYKEYRRTKVFDKLKNAKEIAALKRKEENDELIFYLETQNWSVIQYKNVITQDYNYFQRGAIHDIAQDDENQFNYDWKLTK
jgi:hypothetical protein